MRAERSGGFTLLEIVIVIFILGILAASLAVSLGDTAIVKSVEAENRSLDSIVSTITESFESEDLSGLNVAALPGTIGPGDTPTTFSTGVGSYSTTSPSSWFAKVGKARGVVPLFDVPPDISNQPALAKIAQNERGQPRHLFVGPDEPKQQRFLLISVVAANGQLVLPAFDGSTAWFEAIWQNEWESRSATLPAYWATKLSASELAAWRQGSGGLTQAWRLCVRKIVLPKYRVTVNSNHPTNAAFVSYNHQPNAFTAPANTGSSVSPEILSGRVVVVNQGTAWPGSEALRLHLHRDETVTLQ